MPRGFDRKQRIADLIQQTLAQIIHQEMHDERFRFVTVMGVEISKDYSFAKVYVSVLAEEADTKDIIDGLNHAAKYLRHALANAVELRVTPELRFYYDDSNVRGYRISSLLNSTLKKTDEDESQEE